MTQGSPVCTAHLLVRSCIVWVVVSVLLWAPAREKSNCIIFRLMAFSVPRTNGV